MTGKNRTIYIAGDDFPVFAAAQQAAAINQQTIGKVIIAGLREYVRLNAGVVNAVGRAQRRKDAK